jgi:Fe2+ or Zn2+ uptake regulation protein
MIIIINKGNKMSKQRQVVLQVVTNSCDHPTAETVLFRCKEIMPSINIATVYRNLGALVKQGLINKISQDEGDRFDKTLHSHAHFKCLNCGALTDLLEIDVESIKSQVEIKYNLKIGSSSVLFDGVCDNCLRFIN